MIVSAPGKVMLLGDYAVLDGGSAIVAAVNRRAVGRIVETGRASVVVDAVLARAGRSELQIEIDTLSFYDGDLKLGLGSSAAVAVVAAALAMREVNGSSDTENLAPRMLELAVEGHRDANNGRGSGVDVAACFHGGVIATGRQPAKVLPLAPRIAGISPSILFTNKSASTKDLVARCTASPEWPRWSRVLRGLTDDGLDAWVRQDAPRFLSIVSLYSVAMAQLGEGAGVAIVTEELEAIARYATEGGGAGKPSGAGGGDIGVVWSADPELPLQIAERVGARLLDLDIDPRGVCQQDLLNP